MGPKLAEFERRVAERVGAAHAVAVNSGTSGLHLCVKAADVGEGDEVITTPFSFVASANCVLQERGIPVFVDIDPETYNIDPARIEAAVTPKTKAILPVHVFGRPCRIQEIQEIAARHGLAVIEDACEAIGASCGGRAVGTFGQTGVFAFYPNKQITTGEGGVIVTQDEAVARLCRSWRNQGRADDDRWLLHEHLGYNYRLSDIACALGIAQLARLDAILAMRARIAEKYGVFLREWVPEVVLPSLPAAGSVISWFVYVVRLREDFSAQDRDQILALLRQSGIGCKDYFAPIHLQPFYRRTFGYRPGSFPIAERVSSRAMALPFFNRLSDAQIEFVCEALAAAIAKRKRHSFAAVAPMTHARTQDSERP